MGTGNKLVERILKSTARCFSSAGFIFFLSLAALPPSAAMAATTDYFVIRVKTDNTGSSGSNQFIIPTTPSSGYNYNVDLDNDDGTWEYVGITGNTTCIFATAGTYTIRISGTFSHIYFNNAGDRQKLLSVEQWGTGAWTSMENAFYGCSNLVLNATDTPNLSNATNLAMMFRNATSLNQAIGNWDIGHVTNLSYMFYGASAFNQPLGAWNTSNVTNMIGVFWGATAFNQNINTWNTGKVMYISAMFVNAISYNQPLDNWNTDNVVASAQMFRGASSFNQPIGNWNMSKVTNMTVMFQNASAFNQPIGGWDTGSATNMSSIFENASSFNQDISNWDIRKVTTMENMFSGATLSRENYDALLIGWNAQAPQSNMLFHAGNSMYCSPEAASARNNLIAAYNWTITDGGYVTPTPSPTSTISATASPTPSCTPTPTISPTSTVSPTISATGTISPTSTVTPTATPVRPGAQTPGRDVSAYPNPGRGQVSFLVKETGATDVRIELFNMGGERIAQLKQAGSGEPLVWECGDIAPGIYIYRTHIKINGQDTDLGGNKIAIVR